LADRNATKAQRLAEFISRLTAAPAASDFDSAYALVCDTMNAVEDDMTDIPNIPANWMTDGRRYPPQRNNLRAVSGRADVKRFRSVAHNTLIGDNGAIEIRTISGAVIFAKPGADGRNIRSSGGVM
jgi:hypothetical protein